MSTPDAALDKIFVSIRGIPYSKPKSRGDVQAPQRWSEAVIQQTMHLPLIKEHCFVRLTFHLPPDQFPNDLPYGPDLDNLLKRTFDALQLTVFKNAPGKDSCVVAVFAMKEELKMWTTPEQTWRLNLWQRVMRYWNRSLHSSTPRAAALHRLSHTFDCGGYA
jgi:Endodeoxyribonuclease RusA